MAEIWVRRSRVENGIKERSTSTHESLIFPSSPLIKKEKSFELGARPAGHVRIELCL